MFHPTRSDTKSELEKQETGHVNMGIESEIQEQVDAIDWHWSCNAKINVELFEGEFISRRGLFGRRTRAVTTPTEVLVIKRGFYLTQDKRLLRKTEPLDDGWRRRFRIWATGFNVISLAPYEVADLKGALYGATFNVI